MSVGGGTAASGTDYAEVDAFTVTISAETASGTGTFTLTPTNDTIAEGNETIDVNGAATGFTVTKAEMTLTDDAADVPSVQVFYASSSYSVDEGSSVTVTVNLSADPQREVEVPITAANQGGAGSGDYSVVPASVTFVIGETATTFTFTATDDTDDDDGESVLLGFGTLPTGVTAPATTARPATATVAINDNDDPPDVPSVTVGFEKPDHPTVEGARAGVSLTLSAAPQADTTIEIMVLPESTASTSDYRVSTRPVFDAGDTDYVQLPANEKFNVTFVAGETSTNFGISILPDTLADEGVERIVLGFGALPAGILQGSLSTTTVTIRDGEDDGDDTDDTDDTDDDGDANAVPTFSSPASFSVAENRTAAGTVAASDNDSGDTMTGYALAGGADHALFSIGLTSGVLTFGSAPNYEDPSDTDTNNSYLVEVRATSGTGAREQTTTQSITVTVTDVNEPPARPSAPQVTPTPGLHTSLDVRWTEPGLAGGPAIIGYELRYREGSSGTWTDRAHPGTATATAIDGLRPNTSYEVQVRAYNGEAWSEWSPSGRARTTEPETTVLRSVRVVNGPGADGVWSRGERVRVQVRYSLPVTVERPEPHEVAEGAIRGPVVVLAFGTGDRPGHGHPVSSALAEFTGGSGTETLTFACDVSDAGAGAPSVVVASGGLLLHGATIRTLEGGDSESESTHTGVFHVHVPPARDGARGWTPGETVRVEVTFTGPAPGPYNQVLNRDEVVVDTTGGTPAIGLRLGAHGEDLHPTRPARTARYVSGTGTETLTFEYPVTASDGAVHVVEVTADSLALEGATIRNQRGFDADLEHQSSEWFAWRDVDVPRVKVSVRGGDRAPEGETLAFTVALAEGSVLPVRVEYETANGTAKAGEDYKAWSGSLQFAPGETEKTVRVPLLADARTEGEETVRLRLVKARTSWPFARMVDIVEDEAQGTILDGTGGGGVTAGQGGAAADGKLRGSAGRARRCEPVPGANCVQRGGADRQPCVPRPRHRGDGGPCDEGAQAGERAPGPVGGDGRAGIVLAT